jgi:hypothetical protein
MPPSSRRSFRLSLVMSWLRSLALVLFVFAIAPGAAELFEELACAAAGVECCDGDCCDGGAWDACPKSCMHCACCPHAPAAPAGEALELRPSPARLHLAFGVVPGADAAGYRAPPFRPPLV